MNRFKSLIAALVSVFLLASCLVPVTGTAASLPSYEKQLELLSDLSLLPDTFVADFKPQKGMSRAEFASLCTTVFNLKEYDGRADMTNAFVDVISTSRYFEDIMEVNSFGLMTGDGGVNFNPDEKITHEAVVKVIMTALGYDKMAQALGGYPYGYIRLAGDNNITDGISGSTDKGYIIGADIIIMMYNALNVGVLSIDSIVGGDVVMSPDEENTLLSVFHGIKGYHGVLQGVYGKQLISTSPLESDELMFDGRIYKVDEAKNYSKYFGHDVDFYYNKHSKKIVAIADKTDINSSYTIKTTDIESFNDTSLTYYDNESKKEKKINISPSATVVYNGRPCSDFTEADFITGDGSVTLIDNTGDNRCDVVELFKTVNYVVKSASGSKETVYDMYGNGSFSVEELENVVFVDEFGTEMNFDELFEYDVISVAQSRDKLITTIIYSNNEAEGTLGSIDVSAGYMIINDTKYDIAANFRTEAANIKLGTSGLFILDVNGSVAAFKTYENSYKYAYLIGITTPQGLDDNILIKIINASGEFEIFPVNDKMMLDGVSVEGKTIPGLLSNASNVIQQPIRYYTVSGRMRSIDTTAVGNGDSINDTLRYLYKGYNDSNVKSSTLQYNSKQMIFGGKVALYASTTVFIAPAAYSTDEESFSVKPRTMFSNKTSYAVNALVDKEGEQVADAVVYYGTAKRVGTSNDFILIDKITRATDDNGEECYKISGLRGGKYVSYLVDNDSLVDDLKSIKTGNTNNNHKLECGDIIDAGVHSVTKKITSIYLYYEKSNDFARGNIQAGASIDSENRALRANVYSKDGTNIWLTQNELSESGVELDIANIESINAGLYTIYRYTTQKSMPTVELGIISDIVDYKSAESDFSKVVTLTESGNPGVIVVYN